MCLSLCRNDEEYEYETISEEEVSDEDYYNETPEKSHLVADISGDGEELSFFQTSPTSSCQNSVVLDEDVVSEPLENETDDEERSVGISDDLSFYSLPEAESEEHSSQEEEEEVVEMISSAVDPKSTSKSFRYDVNTPAITTRAKSACTSFRYVGDEPSLRVTKKIAFVLDDDKFEGTVILSLCMFRSRN